MNTIVGKKQLESRRLSPDIKLGNRNTIRNKRGVTIPVAIEKLEEGDSMDWNTIYIVGKEGFKKEVFRKLEHSDVSFMPGNLGNLAESDHDMYWLDKNVSLRSFKEAIGAKAIWKYRIKFFGTLEQFIASQEKVEDRSALTPQDKALIKEMRRVKS